MERLEQSRRSILKKGIEMNDRHAISLRINAAISTQSFAVDKSKKRLSTGGVRRWIEGLDTNRIWEENETDEDDQAHDTAQNQSVTAAVKI
jgi:cysteine synthase